MSDVSQPRLLNVGCGRNTMPGWINLDFAALPGVDVVADLETCRVMPIPLESGSIDEFLLSHVIEHIRGSLDLMQELYRLAKPNAKAVIRVPHGGSDDAWEDPTHIRAYFAQSFGYFSQPFYWRADYGYRGDWQPKKITFYANAQLCRGMDAPTVLQLIQSRRNVVQEMVAELEAIKPARPPLRELQIPAAVQIALV